MLFNIVGADNTALTTVNTALYNFIASSHQSSWNATETNRDCPVAGDMILRSITVRVATAPGATKTRIFTVMKNGAATACTVTISDTNTQNTSSNFTGVTFVAGDTISMRSTATGTPTDTTDVYWSINADSGNSDYQVIFGGSGTTNGVTGYQQLQSGTGAWLTTAAAAGQVMPLAGNFTAFYTTSTVAPGTGTDAWDMGIFVNGSISALATLYGAAETGTKSVTGTVAIAAGDTVAFGMVETATSAVTAVAWSAKFEPTTAGECFLMYGSADPPSIAGAEYEQLMGGGNGSWIATESGRLATLPTGVMKGLYAIVGTAPDLGGGVQSWTIAVRENSVTTAASVTISETATTGNASFTVPITAGNLYNWICTPTGAVPTMTGGLKIGLKYVVEAKPTIVLNTANATDFGSDTTPTLEMTATDPDSPDPVRYNVQIHSSTSFGTLVDSYSETNQSTDYTVGNSTGTVGQSFTGNGATLGSVSFYLKKTGNPSHPMTARIRTHAGTFGTSSVPTGTVLATSETIDISTLTTSYALVTFKFTGTNRITLTNAVNYVVDLDYSTGTDSLLVGVDNTSPSHGGNAWKDDTGAASGADICFYVYSVPLLDKISGTDPGFANTTDGGDTDPFDSAELASYTVQAGGSATINYDNAATLVQNGFAAGGARTWSHTNTNGSILVVSAELWQDVAGTGTITAMTYNGVTMTQATALTTGAMRAEIWYLLNPSTGTNTVSATVTGDTDDRKFVSSSYSGVGSIGNVATNSGGTGNPTVSVTTTVNNAWVIDAVAKFGTTAFTIGANQISLLNDVTGSTTGAASYEIQPTAGSTTMSWTNAGAFDWSAVALEIKPTVYGDESLTTGTYYWRARASDPAGTNTFSNWTASRSFTVTAGTTTTQTMDGKARIEKVVTQTQTGKARITATTTKTLDGKARVTKSASQTLDGKARVTASTTQTQTGKARLTATTTQTRTGKASILKSASQTLDGKALVTIQTTQTQTGKARVTGTTTQTQTGKARIAATSTQTLNGKARVTVASTQVQTGKARITVATTQTQTGKARVTNATTQTQTGKARVTNSSTQTLDGKARLQKSASQTLDGKSRITASTSQTQTGKARVTVSVTQTTTGKARITDTETQVLTGKASVQKSATQTLSGVASIASNFILTVYLKAITQPVIDLRVVAAASGVTYSVFPKYQLVVIPDPITTTTQTITGKSRITISTTQTLTGKGRITVTTTQTLTGKARIQATVTQTQTGLARIQKAVTQTLDGKARVTATTTQTLTGTSRVTATSLQTLTGKADILKTATQTLTGVGKIADVAATQTIDGKSRMTGATTQTLTGKASILSTVSSEPRIIFVEGVPHLRIFSRNYIKL